MNRTPNQGMYWSRLILSMGFSLVSSIAMIISRESARMTPERASRYFDSCPSLASSSALFTWKIATRGSIRVLILPPKEHVFVCWSSSSDSSNQSHDTMATVSRLLCGKGDGPAASISFSVVILLPSLPSPRETCRNVCIFLRQSDLRFRGRHLGSQKVSLLCSPPHRARKRQGEPIFSRKGPHPPFLLCKFLGWFVDHCWSLIFVFLMPTPP